MELKAQPNDRSVDMFKHDPLDLNSATIRLVEVLPSDGTDIIPCRIRHATIEASYTCLSYVWGPADFTTEILIDGKRFTVRQNLRDFMEIMRFKQAIQDDKNNRVPSEFLRRFPSVQFDQFTQRACSLWIDAICIDQGNNDERNYQVQQMGQIYRNASSVIAWMGDNREIASFFKYMRTKSPSLYSLHPIDKSYHLAGFIHNAYWSRAWITQEILLARGVYFLAGTQVAELALFDMRIWGMIASLIEGPGWPPRNIDNAPRTLLESLWHSRFKKCLDPRDIVYSVLAISTDGQGLNVRYDIEITRLALDVLLLYKHSLCLCHAKIVLRALKISAHTRDERGRPHSDRPFVEVNASRLSLNGDNTYCSRCHGNIGLWLSNKRIPRTARDGGYFKQPRRLAKKSVRECR